MVAVTIKGDLRALENALQLQPKLALRAAVSSVNRTAQQAQTKSVRELASSKRLPVRVIKARTRIVRASARRLSAFIYALTAGLPIDTLRPRRMKRGWSAAGQRYPQAFQPPIADGNRLFERRVVGGKRAGRLPIERIKIPLNPEAARIFDRQVRLAVATTLPAIFNREFAFRLTRGR